MNIQPLNTAAAAAAITPHQAVPERAKAARELQLVAPGEAAQAPPPAQDAKDAQDTKDKGQQLDQAVKAVSDFIKQANNSLAFSVDEDSGTTIVKVIDNDTKEVIKQIPSEEMLAIAKALDSIKGLLIHQKA
ncbi:MAG: flagellar protein FlaG [Betaproteobacteria bacterium]|nr:flagellar protein FlaG [Betaproteobacteria bacterium]